MPRYVSPEHKQGMIDLYLSGHTAESAAAAFGHSKRCLLMALRASGHEPRASGSRRYTINEGFFSAITTPEQAYILGLAATDGYVRNGMFQIALQRRDRELLFKVRDAMQSNAPVSDYEATLRGKKYPYSVIMLHSKKLTGDLATAGIHRRKSLTVRFWDGPPPLMPHYARGLLDGDGSPFISARGKPHFSFVGNPQMVRSLSEHLQAVLDVKAPREEPRGNIVVFRFDHLPSIHKVIRHVYKDSTIHLDRKKSTCDTILTHQPRCEYRDWSHITREQLLAAKEQAGTWVGAAIALGIPPGTTNYLRKRLGLHQPMVRPN